MPELDSTESSTPDSSTNSSAPNPLRLSSFDALVEDMPPAKFTDSPNARSKSISHVETDTFGVLNRHATKNPSFQVGVSEDKGTRRTMEDAHSFVVDFDSIRGQGFFAVFDGHAGKHAAEWCGNHFHEALLNSMHTSPDMSIPDVLNETFHTVDEALSKMCEESEGKIHSGCTAVTAFLRVEDLDELDSPVESGAESAGNASGDDSAPRDKKKPKNRIKQALQTFSSGKLSPKTPRSSSPKTPHPAVKVHVPPPNVRRVLYCANAGDARGVLCRAGKAVRLTYDHKGSDKQEAKRITDAGGFVMSGRVNGVLNVTRALGDSSMKDFVVGAPYTTETELCEEDEYLIMACDGLWDVISDQGAVDLIHEVEDAQYASQKLLKYALSHHTTDNVTVMVVRFKHTIPRTA